MNVIDQAILKTVIYADVFDCGISFDELYRKLICTSPVNKDTLEKHLAVLVSKSILCRKKSFVSLAGHTTAIKRSFNGNTVFKQKMIIARKRLRYAMWLPFIEGVFITGSLAAKNSDINDDIDVLVVASNYRLWIARMWVVLYSELMTFRKRPDDIDVKNKLCFNLFLESSSLEIPKDRRSLYTAFEVIQVVPVFTRNNCGHRFLASNSWILRYFGNLDIPTINNGYSDYPDFIRIIFTSLSHLFFSQLNYLLYVIQLWYMRNRKTREFVDLTQAFFHPRKTNVMVMDAYRARKKRFGLV